jgi:hypothetical protein
LTIKNIHNYVRAVKASSICKHCRNSVTAQPPFEKNKFIELPDVLMDEIRKEAKERLLPPDCVLCKRLQVFMKDAGLLF